MRIGDDLGDRAARENLAEIDIGDLVTLLGLVHVMGRDEHGEPVRGEAVNLVPEIAPGLGIDAGGRLVEQQNCGLGSVQAPSASRCFQPPDSLPATCCSRPMQA